jgi:hypothetical protein
MLQRSRTLAISIIREATLRCAKASEVFFASLRALRGSRFTTGALDSRCHLGDVLVYSDTQAAQIEPCED